ncbi:MAG: hypothetical protein IBX70_11030 [Clostridia bacterium]|nr:hypothetical protein [Clostridia bacterium]
MKRSDLILEMNNLLEQKVQLMEQLVVLLENLDESVSAAFVRPSLDAIDGLQKQLLGKDVLFLSLLQKFLSENEVKSLGELPVEDLAPLKQAQSSIRVVDELQSKVNAEMEHFLLIKDGLKGEQIKEKTLSDIHRAYGKNNLK